MRFRLLLLVTLLLTSSTLLAQRQRVEFVSLINRASAPQIFLDNILLPNQDGSTSMAILFRFDHDFMPFKKITPGADLNAPEGAEFYTIARLNAEIFEGRADRRSENTTEVNVASRDMWIDTLYTSTFEQTLTNDLYASGSLVTELNPGVYNYVLQLSLIENTNDRNSNRQNVLVPNWKEKPTGEVYLIKDKMETQDHLSLPLMNLSDNVVFGENFHALVRIPRYDDETEYRIGVYRAETSRRDTTKGEQVFNRILASEHIYHKSLPIMLAGEEPTLSIQSSDSGFTYALVEIPNETFQNSTYTLELLSGSSNKSLAKTFFRSYWADMPASLLNLDIAIDHLKFILDESQLKELKSGTPEQKEKKLRAFWDQRDPTKGTVFNELMAEYYRRIDYAFEEFSNRGNLAGHESDQGKVYISYGPPDSKDRQFPPNGKVIEIWKYGNKNFVFEASTGFGDFKLVGAE